MRKLIVGAQVSIDGVMQAPGLPTEDPTSGFKFGGWVMPYADQEFGEEIDHLFRAPFDLLLGRKTYENLRGLPAVLRRSCAARRGTTPSTNTTGTTLS